MQTPQAQFARTPGGATVPYWRMGSGPPVLHFPTNPVMRFEADLELPELADWFDTLARGASEIRFDSRGAWRQSPEPGDFGMDALLEDAEAVLDATGQALVAVIAIHQSARSALKLAATRPDAVSPLFLWIPSTRLMDRSGLNPLREVDETIFAQALGHMLLGWDAANAFRMGEWLKKHLSIEMLKAQRADESNDDASPFYGAVRAPTLIVNGLDGTVADPDSVVRLASEIPAARLVNIPGSGVPQTEEAREYLRGEVVPLLTDGAAQEDEPSGAFRTILFTDVEASTELTDSYGDAKARDILREHERLTREALSAHGGTEVKTMGDGFLASFTSASSALDAAIAMQQAITGAFAETETPIRIRVGINAGEPIEEEDDLYGAAVIRAARVMGEAEGGEILVADVVRQLVAGKPYTSAHDVTSIRACCRAARLLSPTRANSPCSRRTARPSRGR